MSKTKKRDHSWGIRKKPVAEGNRLFAEFLLSGTKSLEIVSTGIKLPSFPIPFLGYHSLSVDKAIVKVNLSDLPRQYGRSNGGSVELAEDIRQNLQAYGTIVDCGVQRGIAGRGFIVFETSSSSLPLQHELPWNYHHMSNQITPETHLSNYNKIGAIKDSITIHATWAQMTPFCRYCHESEHVISDCPKRKAAMNCYFCNAYGHLAKSCSRKTPHVPGSSKHRKTSHPVPEPSTSSIVVLSELSSAPRSKTLSGSSSVSHDTASSDTSSTSPKVSSGPSSTLSEQALIDTSSASHAYISSDLSSSMSNDVVLSDSSSVHNNTSENHCSNSSPVTTPNMTDGLRRSARSHGASPFENTAQLPVPKICPSCKLTGHVRTNHKDCLLNPKRLAAAALTDITQDRIVDDSPSPYASPSELFSPDLNNPSGHPGSTHHQ